MKISVDSNSFVPEKRVLSMSQEFDNNFKLFFDVNLLTDKFVEYQKDLFREFIGNFVTYIQDNKDLSEKQLQREFESRLQNINSTLSQFADKIDKVDYFQIRGFVQIVYKNSYFCSMIGDVSLAIIRNQKVNYMVDNEALDDVKKIDIFSDFIQGELENNDNILLFGLDISNFMTKEDLQNIFDIANQNDRNILAVLKETMLSKTEKTKLIMFKLFQIEFNSENQEVSKSISKNKNKFDFVKYWNSLDKYIEKIKNWIFEFRYALMVSGALIFIVFLIYSFVSMLTQDEETETMQIITDLKEDVQQFQSMDADDPAKTEKYEEINTTLETLKEQNRWPEDVRRIQELIDEKYYEHFNVHLLNDNSIENAKMFDLDNEELGSPLGFYYNDSFDIYGTGGVLLGAKTDDVDGRFIEFDEDIPLDIQDCGPNLLNNGLYCFDKTGEIINVTNSGISTVLADGENFSEGIIDIGYYGQSNVYFLLDNAEHNNEGEYIVQHTNQRGSQTEFSSPRYRKLREQFLEEYKDNFSSGFSNFVVDGSFLMRNRGDKSLYQFWSQDGRTDLNARKVDMIGGPDTVTNFSENVQIYAYEEKDRLVYFYDEDNEMFSVYRSTPHKTNTAYNRDFDLRYMFSFKFSLTDSEIVDIFVDGGADPRAYMLTDKGVYNLSLSDFISRYLSE